MARRRLLTILAASAVFGATVAGPAAAADLVGSTQDSVLEVTEETVEVAEPPIEDVVEPVVVEPVAEVTEAVVETVAPEPSPSPSPSPAPSPSPSPTGDQTDASHDESSEALVAAGDVTTAPSLAFLTGTRGGAPAGQARLDLPTTTVTDEPRANEPVQAPQVAPAPAEVADAPASSQLVEAVGRAVRDEGTPIVVLVAIASLLAAGFATVREARAVAA